MAENESQEALIQNDSVAETAAEIDACWQEIGVWASHGATCPVLNDVIHCRNCPTYVQAGRDCLSGQLLPDAAEMEHYSAFYRQAKQYSDSGLRKVTLFRLGAEWFALDTAVVGSILKPQPCCWVPHRSSRGIKGIANVDGDALVVVSMAKLLGIRALESSDEPDQETHKAYPRMMTIGKTDKPLVIEVDEVWGQARYSSESVIPLPSTVSKAAHKYSIGLLQLEDKRVGLLDSTLLLYGLEQAMK
ncbi:chemotaxis protein CheW [Endozoicomonas elysicola]|uniref:chemotaxis protein CheW n=1 Tax=Endozoicomonas elysicola TaxID=305900 RepID=UPI00037232CD|nr:chemotaxis protein CheW [Endozoicomonas elysicola]